MANDVTETGNGHAGILSVSLLDDAAIFAVQKKTGHQGRCRGVSLEENQMKLRRLMLGTVPVKSLDLLFGFFLGNAI